MEASRGSIRAVIQRLMQRSAEMTTMETTRTPGMSDEALQPDSTATPFSTFISAVVSGNLSAAEALLADNIEWGLMPTGQTLKGKKGVMPWLKAGAASRKEPVTISDLAAKDWGIFGHWNIGLVTEELSRLAINRSGRGRKIRTA
jgi:hypothetical protein